MQSNMLTVACCGASPMLIALLPFFSVAFLLSTPRLQPVEAASNFTIDGDEYECDGNIICLGDAHIYEGIRNRDFHGRLSLAHGDDLENDTKAGIAYYKEPVRLLDPKSRRLASFYTTFQFFEVPVITNNTPYAGDGMTFVISADNSTVGYPSGWLGVFDEEGYNSFKSLVIEFDSWLDPEPIRSDINDNHVSIDINNISAAAARNASEVGIHFYNETRVFVWIEYTAGTETIEVRISTNHSRPASAFISHRVYLHEAVDEHMWVGFSGANGGFDSAYYVGNWSFESYGIPAEASLIAASSKRGKLVRSLAIIGGICAFVVAVVFVLVLWYFQRRASRAHGVHSRCSSGFSGLDDNRLILAQEGYRFKFEELRAATRDFADEAKLGEGGGGSVYRGELPNSKVPVAVTRILRESQQGEKEFRAEVSIISQLTHRNLMRLLGWCIDDGKYYIVYDLMLNGSLDKFLKSDQEKSLVLSWAQRFKIIQGTAAALEYLHRGWNQQVIHRDVKASNIMLDENFNAKLGDFGLERLTDHQRTP